MRTISAANMAIVKSTAPALESQGLAITTRMYERLFVDPEIKAMFERAAQVSGGRQAERLAGAILAYARNIDKLEALGPAVEKMVARHIDSGVKPEHYPAVAAALLPAIRDVLGADVATDAVLEAWGEAYWMLADILIGKEAAVYDEAA